jgi:hypothetical protein
MTPHLARYAEVTRALAEERERITRENAHAGRPPQSLAMADLVLQRTRLAIAIADAELRRAVGR